MKLRTARRTNARRGRRRFSHGFRAIHSSTLRTVTLLASIAIRWSMSTSEG
jgi:hypothetical protein